MFSFGDKTVRRARLRDGHSGAVGQGDGSVEQDRQTRALARWTPTAKAANKVKAEQDRQTRACAMDTESPRRYRARWRIAQDRQTRALARWTPIAGLVADFLRQTQDRQTRALARWTQEEFKNGSDRRNVGSLAVESQPWCPSLPF